MKENVFIKKPIICLQPLKSGLEIVAPSPGNHEFYRSSLIEKDDNFPSVTTIFADLNRLNLKTQKESFFAYGILNKIKTIFQI